MQLLPPEPPERTQDRELPDWINGYLEFVQYTEPPLMYHIWVAIGAISCVLERKCWLDWMDEVIYPNQYILLLAPPGMARKSTAINCVRPFLAETMVNMAPSSITGEAFIEFLIHSKRSFDWGDGIGLNKNFQEYSSACFVSGEMSNLVRENDMRMQRLVLDLYDCPTTWEYATKHAGGWDAKGNKDGLIEDNDKRRRKVTNACVNIIGATTPAWLNGDENTRKAGKEGLYRRYMIVFERDRGKIVANPFEFKRDPGLKKRLVNDMQLIYSMSGPFLMDKHAMKFYVDFYTKQCKEERDGSFWLLQEDVMKGYVSCRATHLRKAAMVMSASRSQDRVITLQDIERAFAIMEKTEKNMPRAFHVDHSSTTADAIKEIMAYINARGQATKQQIYKDLFQSIDPYMLERGMKVIENMGVYDVVVKIDGSVFKVKNNSPQMRFTDGKIQLDE